MERGDVTEPESSSRLVEGTVVLPPTGVPAKAAEVVVQVEDVSRADAPSQVVGEFREHDVDLRGRQKLSFVIKVPKGLIDNRNLYSLRVHVDVSGSGEVDKGDLISTQTYPVLTRGFGKNAEIHVHQV